MLSNIVMKNLLFAAWKNSSQPKIGQFEIYTYDDNGSLIQKLTKETSTGTILEKIEYEYNLANRLSKVTKTISGSNVAEIIEYKYNPESIRVRKKSWTEVDGTPQGDDVTTNYLIDAYNHTGFAQVFVEDDGTDKTSYIIGDDIVAQATNTDNPEYLLYDGHGSTRQTTDYTGSVTDSFSYDAYGVTLGSPASTSTNLLYAGEQFDSDLSQYYLRARYYDPLNGRFSRMDPFAGNNLDPQSLHKYLYVHANPVNNTDPAGLMVTATALELNVSMFIISVITSVVVLDVMQRARGQMTITEAFIGAIQLATEYAAAGVIEVASMIHQNTRQVGQALRKAAKAIKKTVKDLLKQKPYFVFERLTPNIYKFTISCLIANPMWYTLTWHGNKAWTNANRAWVKSRYGYLRKPGYSIDEFPYASTVEGGKGAMGCAVPWRENCVQGGYLHAHYYWILKKPMTKFLVIPVPK